MLPTKTILVGTRFLESPEGRCDGREWFIGLPFLFGDFDYLGVGVQLM